MRLNKYIKYLILINIFFLITKVCFSEDVCALPKTTTVTYEEVLRLNKCNNLIRTFTNTDLNTRNEILISSANYIEENDFPLNVAKFLYDHVELSKLILSEYKVGNLNASYNLFKIYILMTNSSSYGMHNYILNSDRYIYNQLKKEYLENFALKNLDNILLRVSEFSYMYLFNGKDVSTKNKSLAMNLAKTNGLNWTASFNILIHYNAYKADVDKDVIKLINILLLDARRDKFINYLESYSRSTIVSMYYIMKHIKHEEVDKDGFLAIMKAATKFSRHAYIDAKYINKIYGQKINIMPENEFIKSIKTELNDSEICVIRNLLDCLKYNSSGEKFVYYEEPLLAISILYEDNLDPFLNYIDGIYNSEEFDIEDKANITEFFFLYDKYFIEKNRKHIINYRAQKKMYLWEKYYSQIILDETIFKQTDFMWDLLNGDDEYFNMAFGNSVSKKDIFYNKSFQIYLSVANTITFEGYFENFTNLSYFFLLSEINSDIYPYLISLLERCKKLYGKKHKMYTRLLYTIAMYDQRLKYKNEFMLHTLEGLALAKNDVMSRGLFMMLQTLFHSNNKNYGLAYKSAKDTYELAMNNYSPIGNYGNTSACIAATTLVQTEAYYKPIKDINLDKIYKYCLMDDHTMSTVVAYMPLLLVNLINYYLDSQDTKIYKFSEKYINNPNINNEYKIDLVYYLNFTNFDKNKLDSLNKNYLNKNYLYPKMYKDKQGSLLTMNLIHTMIDIHNDQLNTNKLIKALDAIKELLNYNAKNDAVDFLNGNEGIYLSATILNKIILDNDLIINNNIAGRIYSINQLIKSENMEDTIGLFNNSLSEEYKSSVVRREFLIKQLMEPNILDNKKYEIIDEIKLLNELSSEYSFSSSLQSTNFKTLKELQNNILNNSVILDFKLDILMDKITLLKISKNSVEINKITNANEIKLAIIDYNIAIRSNDAEGIFIKGNYLYRKLIEPYINKEYENLYISPDNFLYNIPFSSLPIVVPDNILKKDSKEDGITVLLNFGDIQTNANDWLGLNYNLSIYNSVNRNIKTRDNKKYNFVGIGNPELNGTQDVSQITFNQNNNIDLISNVRGDLRAIPETEEELQFISKLPIFNHSTLLLGNLATEKNIRNSDALRNAHVISFATHGLLTGEIDGYSEPGLILTNGSGDNNDNGYLSMSEIVELDIQAELVILSACNTAGPQTSGSNALSGISSSFLAGGAEQVLATHWAIDNVSTKELISIILQEKSNSSQPWAHAKKEGIKKFFNKFPQYQSPYYWGAFELFGTELN